MSQSYSKQVISEMKPLRLTGHPFIDVGIDTLTAIVSKQMGYDIPRDEITSEQLDFAAEEILRLYTQYSVVQRYLSVIFTNSRLVQPNFSIEQREEYAKDILFAFQQDHISQEGEERCVFFPELASLGKAYRQHVPLLNGEEISNFSAKGKHGLPISGLALLAIHAMPLGCLPCGGRLLLFHQVGMPNNPQSTRMNYELVKRNYQAITEQISMYSPDDKSGKLTGYSRFEKTQFVRQLSRRQKKGDVRNITGYYFTNYGPSPDIQLVRLENDVLDFIEDANLREGKTWQKVIAISWRRKQDEDWNVEQERQHSNRLFEALFEAHNEPQRLLPFLSPQNGGSWELVVVFLRKVLHMTESEIQLYRTIGHSLASYMMEHNYNEAKNSLSWSFYHKLKDANYSSFRKLVRLAQEDLSYAGVKEPLIRVEQFVQMFERSRDPYHFYLARDLIVMTLVEALHDANFTMGGAIPEEDDEFVDKYSIDEMEEE